MSNNDEASPFAAAPDSPASSTGDAAADAMNADALPADAPSDPSDPLSPAVRRLVRQFDLDITGIRGTGPAGRIRVGDVMGLLGGRTDAGNRGLPPRTNGAELVADAGEGIEPLAPSSPGSPADAESASTARKAPATANPAAQAAFATTTVFDCDLGRVLAHRRKLRRDNVDLLTTSYFVTALAAALEAAPEITSGELARFGVALTTADGRVRSSVLEVPDTLPESLDQRVRAVDIALRANLHTPLEHANFLVHHYGESGSVLATPTPIGPGQAASAGIGRVRREIAVRLVEGVETPRVTARCFLSFSFLATHVELHTVNRAVAAAVAILEGWPE